MLVFLSSTLAVASIETAPGAEWRISSSQGDPGGDAEIVVSLVGDGETTDAQVELLFDESRLQLRSSGRALQGNVRGGGYCASPASGRISVLRITERDAIAPTTETALCTISFAIPKTAPPGIAHITGVNALCVSSASASRSCRVRSGTVSVSGEPITIARPRFESRHLAVLLSAAAGVPTADAVAAAPNRDPTRAALEAFRSIPPAAVVLAVPKRATPEQRETFARSPNSPLARLERFLIVQYANEEEANAAARILARDPLVESVSLLRAPYLSTGNASVAGSEKSVVTQYHLETARTPQMWALAGGWGLVGVADTGLATDHPDLRSFSGPGSLSGQYIGGNFLPALAYDFGVRVDPAIPDPVSMLLDRNVDEQQAVLATQDDIGLGCAALASDPLCAGIGARCIVPASSGHGTHVAGIAAANTANSDETDGVCRRCGIGMAKMTRHVCLAPAGGAASVLTEGSPLGTPVAIQQLVRDGVQVVNMSFGLPSGEPTNPLPATFFCGTVGLSERDQLFCAAIALGEKYDVLMVGASGNDRIDLQYPASDPRVVAVGGLNTALGIWDFGSGTDPNTCPASDPIGIECGTNYSRFNLTLRQELTTPAVEVRSTFYPGREWRPGSCADVLGDSNATNGVGLCTGTSMSAPQVSAIAGVLRSINPLVPAGTSPENFLGNGIRNVLTSTADRSGLPVGQSWDPRHGYGRPNGEAAARMVLGIIRGEVVRNRVTPLFTLYSPVAGGATPSGQNDVATVATPQLAMSLKEISGQQYAPLNTTANPAGVIDPLVAGYSAFPGDTMTPAAPRANIFVLTTEYLPTDSFPAVTPLYLLDRQCSPVTAACPDPLRDVFLTTHIADMESAVAAGYGFKGLQGYVFQRCPGDTCIPTGAQLLFLKCRSRGVGRDCAVFLQNQQAAYEAAGFTAAVRPGADTVLGYAYPNVNSDGDQLIDGFERVIGTNPLAADSDSDGQADHVEFPMVSIARGEPCGLPSAQAGVTCRPMIQIFASSFED